MDEANPFAIVATKTGLSPDQIKQAVDEYRAASYAMEAEPLWFTIMHMSGQFDALAQYGAEGTEITLQVESHRNKAEDKWKEHRYYVFAGKPYELFSEAKAAELTATERRPRVGAANIVDFTAIVPKGE